MSFKPGSASGERYNPVKDQLWKLTPESLVLGSKVDYAEKIDDLRNLFQTSGSGSKALVRWAKKAAKVAAKSIIPLLSKSEKVVLYNSSGFKDLVNQKNLL